ncbi:hypothetical protein [Geobacter sp. DSM 9736]|uniref:hypothetical protein n=1 Tax=Geobacter sp. DSM 9736 TaxID=1277350 RepID=UPI000B5F5AF4|nr:hypothetical protein [Geobacter sp. DSM 9736]SNB44636.1 hypothetical protein SAMN06269301_0023 [Geobacter sp. DSM 9736]
MKNWLGFMLVVSISLFGCGENNTTAPSITPPSQQLKGTYKLVSASGTYTYQDGIISLEGANSITGTLVLGDASYDETLVIDGVTYSRSNGSYIMTSTNGPGEGNMAMTYPNGASTFIINFDDFNLVLTGNPNCKWQKVSD